jgi:hypothetical protein
MHKNTEYHPFYKTNPPAKTLFYWRIVLWGKGQVVRGKRFG